MMTNFHHLSTGANALPVAPKSSTQFDSSKYREVTADDIKKRLHKSEEKDSKRDKRDKKHHKKSKKDKRDKKDKKKDKKSRH